MRAHLLAGQVIPAHPLALTSGRTLDERGQRALTRYYVAAGAGGLAVGVHTTQFEIRDPRYGLYAPVLELVASTVDEALRREARPLRAFVKVAGLAGDTRQAVAEAGVARGLGYHCGLLALGRALKDRSNDDLIQHCREVAAVLPLFGFYLQPLAGGRQLDYAFWRDLAEIPDVWAIKIAPFDRYRTLDVVRAIADAGRDDIALYTGNDDNIVVDLLTAFPVRTPNGPATRRIVGGLLGQWAVWTRSAVALLAKIRATGTTPVPESSWLTVAAALTDANAAIFDAAHEFGGCIPGIHEVLRRQGLMRGTWCLDSSASLGNGQSAEIDRVLRAYPELQDNEFVSAGRDEWWRD